MRNIEINTCNNEFNESGYIIVPNVLTEDECDHYKDLLELDFKKYGDLYAGSSYTNHGLNNKSSEKVVYNMHNKDIRYFDLFDNASTLPIVKQLLQEGSYQDSEPVNLLNISARCPAPYSEPQQLHLDSNLPGRDSYPLIVVVLFMLDDFTQENGPTRVVPKSHRFNGYADNGKVYEEEILLTGKKGSVVIFNGALWHGSAQKHDDSTRWAIILGYGRWFIKPSFDFTRNIPKEIYEQLSDERRRLLGLDSLPPLDEFTRCTRRSEEIEWEEGYDLPVQKSN